MDPVVKKPAGKNCRCGLRRLASGTCRENCPPAEGRRRDSVGVRVRPDRLLSTKESSDGARRAGTLGKFVPWGPITPAAAIALRRMHLAKQKENAK